MDKIRDFSPKPGHFFDFQKRVGLASPFPPSYMPDMKDLYSRIMEYYF